MIIKHYRTIVKILKRDLFSLKFLVKLILYWKINYLILQLHWKNSILWIINNAQYQRKQENSIHLLAYKLMFMARVIVEARRECISLIQYVRNVSSRDVYRFRFFTSISNYYVHKCYNPMEASSSYSYRVFNQYFDAINLINYMSTYIVRLMLDT